MDLGRPPPPSPSSSPLPPATSDGQPMIQTRSLAVSNCRHDGTPTTTSGPQPSPKSGDAVTVTRTQKQTSLILSYCAAAQPWMAASECPHAAAGGGPGAPAFTCTPVSPSRDLVPPLCGPSLQAMPTEILLHILGYLDVCDLLPTSRACHHLRSLCVAPVLHQYRLRRTRLALPPLLATHNRLSLEDLITRSIFLTHTSVVSRKLARSLVSIRLSRRLAARPSPEALVQRAVLPPECVPGMATVHVVPGLIATRRAIEKEKVKDGLRRWIAAKWRGQVREREEKARHRDEMRGVGRVWRLTRFWEQVSRGEERLALR